MSKEVNRNWSKGEWKQHTKKTAVVNIDKHIVIEQMFRWPECGRRENEIEIEADANAYLIADAGTVANKTGLTPSELLDQRDQLKNAIETIIIGIEEGHLKQFESTNEIDSQSYFILGQEAIANAKNIEL